ncbi:MAG: phage integrase SAM-like domain-containing protein [Phycisphaerales bacterium]
MASSSNDPNGRRRIQFVGADGKRRAIRLGKVSQRQALAFKVKIEDLIAAKTASHTPSDETSRWLAALDDATYNKLHRVGLVPRRGSATLAAFTRSYIDGRADIKPSTRINMQRSRSYLLEHFVETTLMRDITEGDAEDFQQHMVRSGRADNTIRKAVGRIRQFFNAAKRRGLFHARTITHISQLPRESIMPGNPQAKIKHIANLVEWHKELSADFDKALPPIYRFNGVTSTGDARRDAWANAGSVRRDDRGGSERT